MSTEEKDEHIERMAKDFRFMKNWWPVFAFICVVAGSLVTLSFKAAIFYQTSIAKKSDIDTVLVKIAHISKKQDDLRNSFDNHVQLQNITNAKTNGRVDSTGSVVDMIRKRVFNGKFVTESYPNGRKGDPTINYNE